MKETQNTEVLTAGSELITTRVDILFFITFGALISATLYHAADGL